MLERARRSVSPGGRGWRGAAVALLLAFLACASAGDRAVPADEPSAARRDSGSVLVAGASLPAAASESAAGASRSAGSGSTAGGLVGAPDRAQGRPDSGQAHARAGPDLSTTAEARFAGFARQLVELVNDARGEAGLSSVALDAEATAFAEAEARRLVEQGVFGHHAPDGTKPYQRWARRGGTARVSENLFRLSATSDAPAYMLFDPASAHERLMRSEGHRGTVLDPLQTGLGVAVAFDRERNSVYVVQEFVAHLLAVEPGPRVWGAGEDRELTGRVRSRDLEPWAAVLYREPSPGSTAWRREARRRSYTEGSSEAALVLPGEAFRFDPATGAFALRVCVPADAAPGPYTLALYVRPVGTPSGAGSRSRAGASPGAMLVYEVVR